MKRVESGREGTREGFPAITVRQPWADLIVAGIKDVENRSWRTKFRGRLLIVAGSRVEREEVEKYRRELQLRPDQKYEPGKTAVIGMVEVVDCVRPHPSRWYCEDHWAWVLRRAVRFRQPVPFKGRLSIFPVPIAKLQGTVAAERNPEAWWADPIISACCYERPDCRCGAETPDTPAPRIRPQAGNGRKRKIEFRKTTSNNRCNEPSPIASHQRVDFP